MKKIFLHLISFILIIFILTFIINSETNYFSDFETEFPKISSISPTLSDNIKKMSTYLSEFPSISQIIGHFTKEDLPIDPDNISENVENPNAPLLCFFPEENIGLILKSNKEISIFGTMLNQQKTNLIARFMDSSDKEISQVGFSTDTEYEFSKTISIPETKQSKIRLDIFLGDKSYGDFFGYVNYYIYLVKNENNSWQLEKSPVLTNNKDFYQSKKNITVALKATQSIDCDKPQIKSVAEQLTRDETDDYKKLIILHDWVCRYLHYDNDSISKKNLPSYTATDVLKSRRAVCLGYANLYAALCRSIKIPCNVAVGYALGISSGVMEWNSELIKGDESNHAWNEAYVNGRWIIIDTTWDSNNNYENNEMKKSDFVGHLYFDANIDYFSTNHKINYYMDN